MAVSTGNAQDEQEKLLDEALSQVKVQSFQMKRCLDKGKLMDGLKHSTNMLGELRTSKLSPRSYYELYIAVTDELRHLELYLLEEFEKGRRMEDLYELVQYAGNIVPRLYLLITVGVVYIKCCELSQREIMRDLVEMCRGVQHPLRGLFLRNYLLQCMRGDLLPDTSVEQGAPDAEKGTVLDSVDFILLNFSEMNKLWVRMQHQGHSRDRERREQERRELRLLVGSNLNRLSQLEAITLEMYQQAILPQILEQIIRCRDVIAHEYLMDVVIQVFPDEFHLATLDLLLRACGQLEAQVPIKSIIVALIDRLSNFAARENGPGIPESIGLFDLFSREIGQIIAHRQNMSAEDIVSLQSALCNLALKVYPGRVDYIDNVLASTEVALANLNVPSVAYNSNVSRELIRLLKAPVESFHGNLQTLLQLHNLPVLLNRLDLSSRKLVTCHILESALENNARLLTSTEVDAFLTLINVLVKSDEGAAVSEDIQQEEMEDFAEEQNLVARCVHLFEGENLEQQYLQLATARKHFALGGLQRLRFTLPPLIMEALSLALKFQDSADVDEDWSKKAEKTFKFVHQCCEALSKSGNAECALKLFLEAALVLDRVCLANRSTMAYEFFTQAFSLYEDEVSDSRSQIVVIGLLISTLERMTCFPEESHSPLRTQCAKVAAKLLKKPDQSRAIAQSAQVFWTGKPEEQGGEPLHDAKRVMSCLDRATRLANDCVDPGTKTQLLIELLNYNLHFALQGVGEVTDERINSLIGQVRNLLADLDSQSEETEQISLYFTATLNFISYKRSEDGGAFQSVHV